MSEYFLGIFWALTYFLIIIGGFKYKSEKQIFMPLIAGALNFAWEIHALRTSDGYWIHIVWLALDCIILSQNIGFLSTVKKRMTYCIFVILSILLLYGVFSIDKFNGMLISSFTIDIIMACEYVTFIKKISPKLLISIGIFRTLGDLFAWTANLQFSTFVCIVGGLVLVINLFYIWFGLDILSHNNRQKKTIQKSRKKRSKHYKC